jgi:LysR family hydrogen peroxide-inducible transcriptional activator
MSASAPRPLHAPHPFTLRQLQYVRAVAELRSFRRAAEACGVSQPALSVQVAQVEELLGSPLFERGQRQVLLTPAGELLLGRIRALLVDADALVEAARRAGDPLAGTLRIGVIPTVAPYLLPRVAPALRAAFPRLDVYWTEDKTPVLAERLAGGRLDAMLLALEADLGEVEHAEVAHDPFVLAVPPGHRLARTPEGAAPVTEEDLVGESVLLLDDGHCFRTQALAYCARAEVRESAFRATSLGTLVQVVAGGGAGITFLPACAVPTEAPRAALVTRALATPVPYRTIVLAWRKASPLAEALTQVAGAMRRGWEG